MDCAERSLAGLLPEEIAALLGEGPRYRATQAFQWAQRRAMSYEAMSNLPKEARLALAAAIPLRSTSVKVRLADPEGTVKLALALADGAVVECVLLRDKEGRPTACLSTQVGCPMGCAFCQTGRLGFLRDLDASEIVEQYLWLCEEEDRIGNVVFMGMGEPMLNLGATRRAIAVLCHPEGYGLSHRKITISTSGVAEGIRSLADDGPEVRLAVSLTTADPELRERLMPVSRSNPLPALKEALLYYQRRADRRITLEAVIMGGQNDGAREASLMAEFARGLDAQVNLIPWNPVPGLSFESPSFKEVEEFAARLEKLGVNCTQRARRGRGVNGACGQLGSLSGQNRDL